VGASVANSAPFLFDYTTSTSDITNDPTTGIITINTAGNYLVSFVTSYNSSGGTSGNNASVSIVASTPETINFLGPIDTLATGNIDNVQGQCILTNFPAGGTLKLINNSGFTLTFTPAGPGGLTNVSASLIIERIPSVGI
jgi:hypothetical protein